MRLFNSPRRARRAQFSCVAVVASVMLASKEGKKGVEFETLHRCRGESVVRATSMGTCVWGG
jgi:hypothetical protein